MPLYEKARAECFQTCSRMLEKYHGPLRDAGVTVDLLFAKKRPDDSGEINPESHALKLHGYPVAAMVKANAYKARVQGHADAEIIIDGDRWDEWSDDEKDALIDHELEHLELKTDKDGNVRRDDLDRPKLRVRLHDHEFGWFDAVARRHGRASFEVQQYEKFQAAHRQLWLDWRDDEPSTTLPISDAPKADRKRAGKGPSRRAAAKR